MKSSLSSKTRRSTGSSKGRRKRSTSSGRRSRSGSQLAKKLSVLFNEAGVKFGVDGKLRVKSSADKERDVVHAAVMESFRVTPAAPGQSFPKDIELALLTTAPIETFGVMQALDKPVNYTVHVGVTTWECYTGLFYGVPAVVTKSDQGPSGSHGSINASGMLCSEWGVKTLWAVGIALGADPKNQTHGDVLAATAVQVYETRERTGADGKKNITLSHAPWTLSKELKAVVESTCATWKSFSGANRGHAGLVVSAPKLLDDASATAEQLGVVRKAVPDKPVIGGEMEMGGVISVCLGAGVPWGVVKGICDFGGLDKAKSKEWQPLATANAVAWMGAAVGDASWIRALPTPAQGALKVMAFDEYTEKKRYGFVGRKELFGKMEAFSGRVLLIKGEAGIGKSALMAEFATRNADTVAAQHFCQFGDASTLDRERWLRSIVGQIVRWGAQHGVSIPDDVVKAVLDEDVSVPGRFAAFSSALPKSGSSQVWILVDSLDEAVQAGGARSGFDIVRAIGRAEFPTWIRIVASTRSDPTVMSALEREIKDVVVMESSSEENLRDVREWLSTMGGVKDSKTIDAVLKASAGNFLYVRQLVVDGDVEKRVKSLPSGLVGIYSARAKALWEDADEFEGDVPVLSVLVAARAPVPLELLKKAGKEAAGGARMNVKRIVGALSSVLDKGKDGAVRVFHKSFVDWCVSVGYDGVKAVPTDGHKGLAIAGLGLWESGNVYAVRHTLAHGKEGGMESKTREGMGLKWAWMTRRAQLDSWDAVAADLGGLEGDIVKVSLADGEERVAVTLALYGGSVIRAPSSDLGLAVGAVAVEQAPLAAGSKGVETRWKGFSDGLGLVTWLPGLRLLATEADNGVTFWKEVEGTWQEAGTVKIGYLADAMCGLPGPDGLLVVAGAEDGIALISGAEMKVLKKWGTPARIVTAVGPKQFLVGHPSEPTASLMDIDGKTLWKLDYPIDGAASVTDGKVLVNGGGTIHLLDGKTGKQLFHHVHNFSPLALVGLSDGRGLLATGAGFSVISDEKCVKVDGMPALSGPMTMLDDGVTLACLDEGGSLQLWDTNSWNQVRAIDAKLGRAESLCRIDEGRLASGLQDASIAVWNLSLSSTKVIPKAVYNPSAELTCAALLTSGKVVAGLRDGSVRVLSAESLTAKFHTGPVGAVAALPGGGWVSMSTLDDYLVVYGGDGARLTTFKGHSESLRGMIVDRDGAVLSADETGDLIRWSPSHGGKELSRVKNLEEASTAGCMGLLQGSDRIAVAGYRSITVIDTKKKVRLSTVPTTGAGYPSRVLAVAGGSKLLLKAVGGCRVLDVASKDKEMVTMPTGVDLTPVAEVSPGVFLFFDTRLGEMSLWNVHTARVVKKVLATIPAGQVICDVLWDGSHGTFHAVCVSGVVIEFKMVKRDGKQ